LFPLVYGPPVSELYCTAQDVCNTNRVTPGPGPILYVAFPYYNQTQTHVNGLDVDIISHFDIGNAGRLSLQFNGTYMFHYIFGLQGSSFDLAGTHGPSIVSGDTGNPKIRGVASVGWDLGNMNLTASINYVGRFNLTDPTAGEADCATAIGAGGVFGGRFGDPNDYIMSNYCEVNSFTTVDLYGQYKLTDKFNVHASILNVLGAEPPIDLTTYGAADDLAYNPAMHQAGAVGRFFNLGVTYTF
jgi:iron complex outermembrane receptor protein